MARLTWGAVEDRRYEGGIDRGVLYIDKFDGEPWNGLVSVKESPVGRDIKSLYYDGVNFLNRVTPGHFRGTISAYSSPELFDACDGTLAVANGLYATEQPRKTFGLSYRTMIGDANGKIVGYKIHIIYNALANVSDKDYQSISSNPEASPLEWDIVARSVRVPGIRPTAHFILDTTVAYPEVVSAVEDILYGSASEAARLPTANELIEFFKSVAYLLIDDHGDGTFTASSTNDVVKLLDEDEQLYEIDYASVIPLGNETYEISTL